MTGNSPELQVAGMFTKLPKELQGQPNAEGITSGEKSDSTRQSFERKLSIRIGLVIFCTALLALAVITPSALDFIRARQNLSDIQHYRLVLDTANLIAAERGPANVVMSEEPSLDSSGARRLAEIRRRVDIALAQLAAVPEVPVGVHRHPVPTHFLASVREQFLVARAKVDRLAATPRASLDREQFQAAIESMFEVSNRFRDIVTWSANEMVQHQTALSGSVLVGQMLSDLRDQGGRMASQIIAPLATGEGLPLQNIIDSRQTQGRVLQLWQAIRSYPCTYDNPALLELRAAVESDFFGEGVKLVDGMIAEGRRGSRYSLTATDLTDRFVPTMRAIEAYRGTLLDAIVARYEHAREIALETLIGVALMTAVAISILVGLLLSIRAHVFQPLLYAQATVIRLAEDLPGPPPPHDAQASEVLRLFQAIDVLRWKLVERADVTSQLRVQAETDGLTALFNRRALDSFAQTSSSLGDKEDAACLILMDIDHFKAVNDTHGHSTGDRVLVQVAQLLRSMLRSGDIIARFGGEEFAILVSGDDLRGAIKIARKIRVAVQREGFSIREGVTLRVTASFGVARGRRGRGPLVAFDRGCGWGVVSGEGGRPQPGPLHARGRQFLPKYGVSSVTERVCESSE